RRWSLREPLRRFMVSLSNQEATGRWRIHRWKGRRIPRFVLRQAQHEAPPGRRGPLRRFVADSSRRWSLRGPLRRFMVSLSNQEATGRWRIHTDGRVGAFRASCFVLRQAQHEARRRQARASPSLRGGLIEALEPARASPSLHGEPVEPGSDWALAHTHRWKGRRVSRFVVSCRTTLRIPRRPFRRAYR